MTVAEVKLWERTIGAVSWDEEGNIAHFEYARPFMGSGIEVAPVMMPLSAQIYSFPGLAFDTFHGLPGLLADSLPDKFGQALINAWLAQEGRTPQSFNSVERLCYIGTRAMGALEFLPAQGPTRRNKSKKIEVEALVALASEILSRRKRLKGFFSVPKRTKALQDILQVGTSAGGARAKAVIAWNPKTNEVRSGQVKTGEGFSYWILKFDGVSGNKDRDLDNPKGYGLIEYAYHKMAVAAGITMNPCHLLKENGRNHFMTKRFDRTDEGEKIHMQSLGALGHTDFNQAGAHSYEQAFQMIRRLDLPMSAIEEQFRRMAFNIMGRNQDDHVKNIAFLMNRAGGWTLSPAFDVIYSYNPAGPWTNKHQMSMNGKRDKFTKDDFSACAKNVSMGRGRALEILKEVKAAILKWPDYAKAVGVSAENTKKIMSTHRVDILP